jgi:hypothetical protein
MSEKVNVLILSANVGLHQEKEQEVVLLLEIIDSAKAKEPKVVGISIERELLGCMIQALVLTFQMPSLQHIKSIPAILEVDGEDWKVTNFIDPTKVFNGKELREQILSSAPANVSDATFTSAN